MVKEGGHHRVNIIAECMQLNDEDRDRDMDNLYLCLIRICYPQEASAIRIISLSWNFLSRQNCSDYNPDL